MSKRLNSEEIKTRHNEATRKYRRLHPDKSRQSTYSWRKKNPEKVKEISRRYRKNNPSKRFIKHLAYMYGLTLQRYKEFYIGQNGCCACCEQPIEYDKIRVDHNHKTGKVRGLLCARCNHFLTAFDDEIFMKQALSYLERNN